MYILKICEKLFVIFATLFICVSVSIKIDSLGRVTHLGYCYDARSGKFLDFSIFKVPLDNIYIRNDTTPGTQSFAEKGLQFKERINHFSLSSSMSLSLALGIISAKGATKVITDGIGKSKLTGGTLMQTVKTETYWIHHPDSRLTQFMSPSALNRSGCTHVITEIEYAIRSCYNFVEGEFTDKSETSSESNLDAMIELLNTELAAGGSWSEKLLKYVKSFSWNFFSDVNFPGPPPSSWDQVEPHMLKVADKAKNSKGMPFIYTAAPISDFRQLFKELKEREDEPSNEVPDFLGDPIRDLVINLHEIEGNLIEYRRAIATYFEVIPRSDINSIISYINKWILELKFHLQEMVEAIDEYRTASINITSRHIDRVYHVLASHYNVFSMYPVEIKLRQEFPDIDKRIERFMNLRSGGVNFINSTVTIDRLAMRRKTFVVLYFRKSWIKEDRREWENVVSIFTGFSEMWWWFNQPLKYMIDCDVWEHECKGITKFTFRKYDTGVLTGTNDYLCEISKSFQKQTTESGDMCMLFRWFWFKLSDKKPDKGKECRSKRKLYIMCGSRSRRYIDVII